MDDDESSQPKQNTVIDIAYCPCGRCKVEIEIDFENGSYQITPEIMSEPDDL